MKTTTSFAFLSLLAFTKAASLRSFLLGLCFWLLLCVAAKAAGTVAAFGGFSIDGFVPNSARGVSADGTVVVIGNSNASRGFIWREGGSATAIDFLGEDVSADGTVVVGGFYRWTESTGQVRISNDTSVRAISVSDDGSVIVGKIDTPGGREAFRWTEETNLVRIGKYRGNDNLANGVSGDGAVVVGGNVFAGFEGFQWTESGGMSGLGTFPDGDWTVGRGASSDGSVIVGNGETAAGSEAFRWTADTGVVGIGDLPGGSFSSAANDVSADGSIVVGESNTTNGGAFVWTFADGIRDLREVLVQDYGLANNLAGWTLTSADAISADGTTIVGRGFFGGRFQAFRAVLPRADDPSSTVLVDNGSRWRYLDNGSNQGTAWREPGFDDQFWAEGPAQLGYGDGDEVTVVNCGPSAPQCNSGNLATTYFRNTFEVEDVDRVESLTALLVRDDAAAVYLNGIEIYRDDNLPGGAAYNTFATATGDENGTTTFAIEPALLTDGQNVLAVEVHQRSPGSSDISFDFRLTATVVPIPEPSGLVLALLGAAGLAAGYRRRRRAV